MSEILQDGISVVRAYTGITSTTLIPDSQISNFIASAERELIQTTGKDFQVHFTSEDFYGNNKNIYIVQNYPLLTVTSLKSNDTTFDPETYYYDRSGLITLKSSGTFAAGLRYTRVFAEGVKYSVDYYYGSDYLKPVAADQIRDVAAIQVLLKVGADESKGADGETFAAHSVSYPGGIPYGTFIDKLKEAISERLKLLGSKLLSFTR